VFRIPTAGGSRERAAGASTREKVQLAVMAALVLVILGWWVAREKKADQRPAEAPYIVEDMAEAERKSLVKREEVLALMDRREGEKAAAEGDGAAREQEKVDPGLAPWKYRGADEIDPGDYETILREERAEEAKRAEFRPMLEEFKPLEPDAVRVYRAKVVDRVPSRGKPVLVLPAEPEVRYTAEKADGKGLTASRPDGAERKFTWDDIPAESLYALGKQVAVVEGPRANEKDAFFLAQLAVLAGKPEEAEGYFKRTVEIKPDLVGKVSREPTTSLDYRILDIHSRSADETTRPMEATSVREDAPSIFHVYRYMRTIGPEGLAEVVSPLTRYELLQRRPRDHEWRLYTIKGRFMRRYKSTRWTGIEGHEEAGIQDIDFCFVRGARWSGIYLVSVPQDTQEFGSTDMVRFTGVYVRRWPYRVGPGEWNWIPWIAALDLEKVEMAPPRGIQLIGTAILALTVVGVIVVFFYARRESKQAAAGREHRVARQRAQRDRIRRKVAEAGSGKGTKESERNGDKAGMKGDADKKPV
jgi:hypothetical protein